MQVEFDIFTMVIFTNSLAAELFWTFGHNEKTNKKIRKHQSFKEY